MAVHHSQGMPLSTLDSLLMHVRWPLLDVEALSHVEARHSALRGNSKLCELLLEGFRFNSADASGKALQRAQNARCRPRKGMLLLGPLLTEGPWQLPAGSLPTTLIPPALSFVWNIPYFTQLSCLSM